MEQPSLTVQKNNPLSWLKLALTGVNMLILLPPILAEQGVNKVADLLYRVLGFLCHQRADRSFYLFGEALQYSKERVWNELPSSQIFTLDFKERFTCNSEFGCKFGVCSRCTGMYLGLLLGVIGAEYLMRIKIPRFIPILFLIPLILDGSVQTFAYILAPERGFYESTNPRRFATGLLFGLGVGYLTVSAVSPVIAK
ncbi:MAG: DUF2085 domain-containing protein [Patescibacteria group bacterium]